MIARFSVQDSEILNMLITEHYDELAPKVLAHAHRELLGKAHGTFEFGGLDDESLVNEAFEKIAQGLYTTQLSAGMNKNQLLLCLFDAVSGICGNLQRLKGARAVKLSAPLPENIEQAATNLDVLSVLESEEEVASIKRRVCVGKNEHALSIIWDAIIVGYSASDIAILADIEIKKVYELSSDLRRRLEEARS
jgi:hypothetical protein